jgi:hypothetical protein
MHEIMCIYNQRAPKFVFVRRVSENESIIVGRQEIVDHDLDPCSKIPKVEPEYAGIVFASIKRLFRHFWHNLSFKNYRYFIYIVFEDKVKSKFYVV